MYRRDYILKMIEEFARAMGAALGLKQEGKDEAALQEIRGAYKTWFALDADLLSSMSDEQFLGFLSEEKKFTVKQIEALAGALKTEAELLPASSVIEKKDRLGKSLFLFEFVKMKDAGTYSEEREKTIIELRYSLDELS